jgi:ketosteroid isomerase-like protein
MKTRTLLITLLQAFVAATVCLAGDAKLEQALRDADEQWSKAAGTKDVDKIVSYYADDAVVMPPNGPAANTKDAVRKFWTDLANMSGSSISWKPTKVEVAKSGDIGFVSGTYEFTMNDVSGKPVTDKGKYLVVWERQSDGKWKCGADMWNSDMPAAPETK